MKEFDVLIIGAGPAGLTCGLYAARANLNVLLLEKLAPGGQIAVTELVENYPGFDDGIMGAELAMKMEAQARKFGLEYESVEVHEISMDGDYKNVRTDFETYRAKVLVIATGTHHRKLDVPGEDDFFGRGVSNCATCDGPLYRGKEVAVVGGGDSAIQESLFLTKFVDKVKVIHRREELRAIRVLAERAMADPKIEFVWNSHVTEVLGKDGVDGVRVKNKLDGTETDIPCDGFFIFVGMLPNTGFLGGMCKADAGGFLITDENCETNVNGIYAVGDVRAKNLRQVVTAAADGAIAAHDMEKYLD
jgi:thioredoxin reductase (NADPH)